MVVYLLQKNNPIDSTLIFPNQLFNPNPALDRKRSVFLLQDRHFFFDDKRQIYFHKKKIMLHLMSTQEYYNELKKIGYEIRLVTFDQLSVIGSLELLIKSNKIKTIHYCNLVDTFLNERINRIVTKLDLKRFEYTSPGFLLDKNDIEDDFFNKKNHHMANFYKKQRRRFNILMDGNKPKGDKWSYDHDNRKKLPKNIQLPEVSKIQYNQELYNSSASIITKNFNDNPGKLKGFNFPVNRKQAQQSFNEFLINRLLFFGDFEDAISKSETYLFHSILTPYLNIGLITPKDILNLLYDYTNKNIISINSHEGFIRQIIGWREFIRGVYEADGEYQRESNFWNFKNKLNERFYTADTDILPLDITIDRVINNSYTHHIERLMVLGNIMLLLNINPNSVYHWFMELFIDAYDWVMVPNIYGMSQFSDSGLMSTKPYISGSNYILKMSNYKKDNWCFKWDALYWNFIDTKRDFFLKNPRMSMMVSLYDKKDELLKKQYLNEIMKLNKKLISLD